jgi:hypothetical protein
MATAALLAVPPQRAIRNAGIRLDSLAHRPYSVGMNRPDTEDTCHCGADYARSDHCPVCGCEQYESGDCGVVAEAVE